MINPIPPPLEPHNPPWLAVTSIMRSLTITMPATHSESSTDLACIVGDSGSGGVLLGSHRKALQEGENRAAERQLPRKRKPGKPPTSPSRYDSLRPSLRAPVVRLALIRLTAKNSPGKPASRKKLISARPPPDGAEHVPVEGVTGSMPTVAVGWRTGSAVPGTVVVGVDPTCGDGVADVEPPGSGVGTLPPADGSPESPTPIRSSISMLTGVSTPSGITTSGTSTG